MKKLVCLLLLVLLILPSCVATKVANETISKNSDSFYIKGELPDIGSFSGNLNAGRFYENFTDDFIPSDEYGEIIPFVGSSRVFGTKSDNDSDWHAEQSYSTYGFCTPDGKIVMDASDKNTYIFYNESEDGFGYYTLTQEVEQREDAPDEYLPGKCFIIPTSGRWVIEYDKEWSWISSVTDGYIYLCEYPKEGGEGKMKVFDYDGNYIKTLDSTDFQPSYSHGLKQIYIDSDDGLTAGYVNEDGEMVLGPYRGANNFNKYGITVIRDRDNLCYLINTKGERLTDGYDNITIEYGYGNYSANNYDMKIFSARHSDNKLLHDIFTPNGEFVKTIEAASYYSNRFPDNGDMIYYFRQAGEDTKSYSDEKFVWKRLSDGSDFVSNEFGVMPNSYSGNDNTYIYLDEKNGGGIIFDGNGETTANLPDMKEFYNSSEDGRYIIYRDGLTTDEIYDLASKGEDLSTNFGTTYIYDTQKKASIYSVSSSRSASFIGENDRYILLVNYDYYDMFGGVNEYWLYDTLNERAVFEGVNDIVSYEIGGKLYINVCTDNSASLYDENLNIVLRSYYE